MGALFDKSSLNDQTIKIKFIGYSKVGKRALIYRIVREKIPKEMGSFRGMLYRIKLDDFSNINVTLEAPYLEQSELLQELTESDFLILVYDITSMKSFVVVKEYMSIIEELELRNVLFLTGNKADLVNQREVVYDEAKAFADSKGIKFIEVSALGAWDKSLFLEDIKQSIFKHFNIPKE